jgi:hypothetical protein
MATTASEAVKFRDFASLTSPFTAWKRSWVVNWLGTLARSRYTPRTVGLASSSRRAWMMAWPVLVEAGTTVTCILGGGLA